MEQAGARLDHSLFNNQGAWPLPRGSPLVSQTLNLPATRSTLLLLVRLPVSQCILPKHRRARYQSNSHRQARRSVKVEKCKTYRATRSRPAICSGLSTNRSPSRGKYARHFLSPYNTHQFSTPAIVVQSNINREIGSAGSAII